MPDFDPKSIPILDDIIEDDDTENSDELNAEVSTSENNLNLFSKDPVLSDTEISEPSSDVTNDIVNESQLSTTDSEEIDIDAIGNIKATHDEKSDAPDHLASALINLGDDEEEGLDPVTNIQPVNEPAIDHPTNDELTNDNPDIEPIQQISLQAMTEDIVKQLMPELKLQLHTLVLQTLQDKLPTEIVKQENTETDD